ncbi:MAG: hypothetical protein ACOYNI_10000 [Acidimicrobiia bacterium]
MANDLRTTATNTGYLIVGLGVVGAQQARIGAETAAERLSDLADRAKDTATMVGSDARARIEPSIEMARHLVEPTVDSLRAQGAGAWNQIVERTAPVRERIINRG